MSGSHARPLSYGYQSIKGRLQLIDEQICGRESLQIEYDDKGRVQVLKEPEAQKEGLQPSWTFVYGDGFTDVYNREAVKSRYLYDALLQLKAIELYDRSSVLQRIDRFIWGSSSNAIALLLAQIVADGAGKVHSYRSFSYDDRGNIIEERLYGNLTGNGRAHLQIDEEGALLHADTEECHCKSFSYSNEGLNLPIGAKDCKANRASYHYDP